MDKYITMIIAVCGFNFVMAGLYFAPYSLTLGYASIFVGLTSIMISIYRASPPKLGDKNE